MRRPFEDPQQGTLAFKPQNKRTRRKVPRPVARAASPLVPQRGGGGPGAGPMDEPLTSAEPPCDAKHAGRGARVCADLLFAAPRLGNGKKARGANPILQCICRASPCRPCRKTAPRTATLLERPVEGRAAFQVLPPRGEFRKGGVIDASAVVGCGATGRFKCRGSYKEMHRAYYPAAAAAGMENWTMENGGGKQATEQTYRAKWFGQAGTRHRPARRRRRVSDPSDLWKISNGSTF